MRFAALRARWYKGYLTGGSLLMAGDNAEHALTYWVMWQLFESPLLAGFAVVSHWLPHLFFSIPFGALADRYDNRRIIQISCGMFMLASLLWAILILSNSLEIWHCILLLLLHGFASALWRPADQVMIYDIVGPRDLPSAVRLMATGLSLGQLVGPAFGAAMLFTVGPGIGMLLNMAMYLPFVIYLAVTPLDGHQHRTTPRPRVHARDVFAVVRKLPKYPSILIVMIVQGATGLFIGAALLPLFPEFGNLLGLDDSGLGYGLLIVSMAAGAVIGGLTLEAIGRIRAGVGLAVGAAILYAACLLIFAVSREYLVSLPMLLLAGFALIWSESSGQTVVQLDAPSDERGRFVGASSVTGFGFRAGSGVLVGILGGIVGVSGALAIDAGALLLVAGALGVVVLARGIRSRADAAVVPVIPEPED
ncbi:MFS transporter [uncultured Schumannella sp.]|uniref:MFS transporter n=1 Tax=uncultured Schumannella sp. TaxID=1195956 RepID=UPI0025CE40B0|nr:MFS transporter [uncultured Schumannella sp.]